MNLPGSTEKKQKKNSSSTLPPAEGGDFGDFLKVEHLNGQTKATLVFLGDVTLDPKPKFGEQVLAKVKLGKDELTWGIRTKSGNYRKLLKKFGRNPENWKGKVVIEVAEFNGNEFISIK